MVEVTKEIKEYLKFRRKLFILNYAIELGNTAKALREFDVNKSTFYKWKKVYEAEGLDLLLLLTFLCILNILRTMSLSNEIFVMAFIFK